VALLLTTTTRKAWELYSICGFL